MDSSISIEKQLFRSAMKGEWDVALELYKNNPTVHVAKISRSGDTALHIAVSNVQEGVVQKLVDLISEQSEPRKALEIKNEQGNTPLHIAASLGNVKMCKCMAEADSWLLQVRNNDGETPLFVAALHGKKDAFLCLNSCCQDKEAGYSYCKRKDGENETKDSIDMKDINSFLPIMAPSLIF
ncbi:serine/threonine-protein phosphatase 6 regulatory ankyrin repeat subunit B-like [Herrania umbratica]|uniref:Serine/threonine-protein phosphatase 6 regulatory ankyrin repeat subunit B-like n=1 Tax=Herrania umbratica TaxID=108875 RepID=A0A6J0ZYL6_9ROSI|nr:serine/threonine-protein phosphatase 6 regulatory ankyrin repeat subunit B-like [Herrania umbratica]